MIKNQLTTLTKRQRLLLVLPLLTTPFLTGLFWALGGGAAPAGTPLHKGLNTELPQPRLAGDQPWDKLSFNNRATTDTGRDGSERFASGDSLPVLPMGEAVHPPVREDDLNVPGSGSVTTTEKGIERRLDALQKVLQPAPVQPASLPTTTAARNNTQRSEDVDRLESLLHTLQEKGADDPEMASLNTLLDKVLDIQHPGRVKEGKKGLTTEEVFTITRSRNRTPVSYLGGSGQQQHSGPGAFYGESKATVPHLQAESIEAVIPESQVITDNTVVKLRLLSAIDVGGVQVPEGSYVYARAHQHEGRFRLQVSAIACQQQLFAVNLVAYDLDGLPGIATRAGKGKEGQATGEEALELTSLLHPSVKTRLATAGIQAARGWFSRRGKAGKIKVPAGYTVWLQPDNETYHP